MSSAALQEVRRLIARQTDHPELHSWGVVCDEIRLPLCLSPRLLLGVGWGKEERILLQGVRVEEALGQSLQLREAHGRVEGIVLRHHDVRGRARRLVINVVVDVMRSVLEQARSPCPHVHTYGAVRDGRTRRAGQRQGLVGNKDIIENVTSLSNSAVPGVAAHQHNSRMIIIVKGVLINVDIGRIVKMDAAARDHVVLT